MVDSREVSGCLSLLWLQSHRYHAARILTVLIDYTEVGDDEVLGIVSCF